MKADECYNSVYCNKPLSLWVHMNKKHPEEEQENYKKNWNLFAEQLDETVTDWQIEIKDKEIKSDLLQKQKH